MGAGGSGRAGLNLTYNKIAYQWGWWRKSSPALSAENLLTR